MSPPRNSIVFTLFCLSMIVFTVQARDLIVGGRVPYDSLICVGDVNLRAEYGRIVEARRICNVQKYYQNITMIQAHDLGYRGNGGYAEIVRGGLGQKNVTLHLWSQRSQPLNFTIQVYAR